MSKYAIAVVGGRQLKISEGDTIVVERQTAPFNFLVLAYSDGSTTQIGAPYLEDVVVSASLVEDIRAKKIRVARFKKKSRYRKAKGHRQPMSIIKIDQIGRAGEGKSVEAVPATVKKEKKEPRADTKATKTKKSVRVTKGKVVAHSKKEAK